MLPKWLICASLFILTPVHLLIEGSEDNKLRAGYIKCDKEWALFRGKCYKMFAKLTNRLSWHNASESCKSHGGHLATVDSEDIQEFLFAFVILTTDVDAWIGLTDADKEAHYVWDDGTKYSYSNWNPNEPTEFNDETADCVYMRFQVSIGESGEWDDTRCIYTLPYICQVDEGKQGKRIRDPTLCSSAMGGGWKFESSCYNLVQEEMNWEDAEKYCQSKYKGHLVKVMNSNVNYFLKYVMLNFSADIWIGIKIKDHIHQHFSSGWNVRYTYWREIPENFVNGTCVIRTKGKLWDVVSCKDKYPFICEVSTAHLVMPNKSVSDRQSDGQPGGYLEICIIKTVIVPYDNNIKPVLKEPPKGSKCPDKQANWMDLGGEYCYFIESTQSFDVYRANFECNKRGGSFASFHSKGEIDALVPFVRHGRSQYESFNWRYHLGLYKSPANKSVFVWADGSQMDYAYWGDGEPNDEKETCTEMWFRNLKWNDVLCEGTRGYICSVKKTSPNVTETEPDCDCINGITFRIFVGMMTVFLPLVVILVSVMIHFLRLWKTERGKRSTVTDVPLHTLDPTTLQKMYRLGCEKCRRRIIENDDHIYEYVDPNYGSKIGD